MEQQEIIDTLKEVYSKIEAFNKGAKPVKLWEAMGDIEDLIEELEV